MKRTQLRSIVLAAVATVSLVGSATVAAAEPGHDNTIGSESCTFGDARALFEGFPIFLPTSGPPPCQYRLFWDGQTRTFCEDDVILGGVSYSLDYKNIGWSRAEAIADLDLYTDRVWLDGEEQVLEETAYKDANTERNGRIVWQHRAFITQLAPGAHVSVYVTGYPGFPDETATVYLNILPRADCD